VLIAGGGFAAVEALLALRAMSADVRIELVSIERRFVYRPAATAPPFPEVSKVSYGLARIARDARALHRVDRLEAVAPAPGIARLASGAIRPYDSLIIATGAQRVARVAGAMTYTGPAQAAQLRRLYDDIEAGAARAIAFCVPHGVTWPLPLYELALGAAGHARDHGADAEITIVTPERAPLEVFGPGVSALVGGLLDDRGVRFLGGHTPLRYDRHGRVVVGGPTRVVHADRAIAVPSLLGAPIAGIPAGGHGFVPVDDHGRVSGLRGVYAAGDITTYPVKHGGLATHQADLIAAAIATAAGDRNRVPVLPTGRMLRARLIGGEQPVELFAVLDGDGRAVGCRLDDICGPAGADADAISKVYGRYLIGYLRAREAGAAAA
jgi:sulfide:quinone oxidoreductase